MKKRIICLVIAFLLLLTLVSCEKEPTLLDITQGVNRNWDSYNQILYYANLETHTAKKAEDVSVFYRCVQEVSFDVVDADGYKASHGLYCYDLSVFLDGTGSLHYRHYVYEPYPNYTLDQEEKVDLTVEEVSSFQSVLREYDFDLEIAVKGLVQVTCDRCLDAMDIAIQAEETEWDWDEEPKRLDLSWLAYELIIVNLPLVHSHQDGGCNPEMDALLQDHLCTDMEDEE